MPTAQVTTRREGGEGAWEEGARSAAQRLALLGVLGQLELRGHLDLVPTHTAMLNP